MVNAVRGEAELIAGDKRYTLLLSLGALAEIENGLGLEDVRALGPRLDKARSADLAIVAAALIRGGGTQLSPADVLALPCTLGTLAAAVGVAFARAGLNGPGEGETGADRPFSGAVSWPPD